MPTESERDAALQGIGIDFGTTNSSVALYDGKRLRYLRLEPVDGGEVMPTALYLSRDRQAAVGRAAIDRYTRDNAGRTVRLSAEEVGAITVTVAGTDQSVGLDDGGSITRMEAPSIPSSRTRPRS